MSRPGEPAPERPPQRPGGDSLEARASAEAHPASALSEGRSPRREQRALARLQRTRLVALFALGWVLFGYPLLGLFSRQVMVLGWPLLYVYVFTVWALYIAVIAWLAERGGR